MLKINNLNKKYDDKIILKNINIEFENGKIYGLVGENGSGKTTLLRLLADCLEPSSGQITYDNQSIKDNVEYKKNIIYLQEDPYFPFLIKVNGLIKFYESLYSNFDSKKAIQIIDFFKLPKNLFVSKYSKGMKRQLIFALSFATNSNIYIIDELFDGLDYIKKTNVKQLLMNEMLDDKIIIISSHNLRDLDDLCSDILLLNKNEIIVNKELEKYKELYVKVQLAYENDFDFSTLKMEIESISKYGKVYTLIIKNDQKIIDIIKNTTPLFFELLPLSFEQTIGNDLNYENNISDLLEELNNEF